MALLPSLGKSSLAITVMRGLLARGAPVAVAFCSRDSGGGTRDALEDFGAQSRLIDLSGVHPDRAREQLQHEVAVRRTRLLFQAGADTLYPALPYLKERNPQLKLVDALYNEVNNTVNHFLYENCFDAVIVEHDRMRQSVASNASKPASAIRIVKSGVDLEYFSPKEDQPEEAPLHVGFIGRMSAEDNPAAFIDIAEIVGLQLGSIRFSLFGEGPLTGTIQQRIAQSSMKARLAYQGKAEDIRTTLHMIDALIVLSKPDGYPNVIMAAAACGIPVIAVPLGGIPELVEEGQNGVLLTSERTVRIAEFLGDLEGSTSLRRQWRAKCRAVAAARFDGNRMLDGYEAIFLEIMGN